MQDITVFITTSPSPLHPSTEIIDNTIKSIRYHLKDCLIMIAADGVRDEQLNLKNQYEQYLRKIEKKVLSNEYGNATISKLSSHRNQTGLIRRYISSINTEYIFWVEHDTPLSERYIDFGNVLKALDQSDFIEFFHTSKVPVGWEDMMLGDILVDGTRYIKTSHWSSRPNIARKSYYERCLGFYSSEAKAIFEVLVYSKVINYYLENNPEKNNHRLLIYAPDDDLMFSDHTDGRRGESTFSDKQVF